MSEIKESEPKPKVGLISLILTIMAAAIGVQTKKNLEKDFSQSSPIPYIIGGVIFTALFMTTVILVVKLVLSE